MRRNTVLLAAIVGAGLFACAANAEVLCWDFTVHPNLEKVPMIPVARDTAWDDGTANGTPYGGCIPGTGLQGDGTAIFADNTCESANSGFVIGGGTGAFTLDVRVKVLEDITQTAGKSMSIADCTSNGRGIKLRPGGIELISGTSVVGSFGPIDMTQWQTIRFSLSCNGSVDICLWDANTSTWTPLGNQGLGGSGWNISPATPAGIAIGSMAGSSTQSGKFQIDWARVDDAQALGCTGSPLGPCDGQKCESTVSPAGARLGSGWVGGLPAVFAKVDLGVTDAPDGLNVLPNNAGFDGNTMPTIVAGRSCRRNVNPASDLYMFFSIDDDRAYQLPPGEGDVYIIADYYDLASGSVNLQYDAGPGNEYADGGSVPMTGTNTWKRATFHVTDAYFGTGQAWGADFRLGTGGGVLHIDNVMVARGNGPEFEYLFFNSGTTLINAWDAVQANADGSAKVPADTWLTLTKTPAPGPLAAGATATVKATVDTTSLAAGTYPVYLKFTDDCASAGYTEAFAYADGSALAGQGGWVGSGETAPLVMEANELKLNGSGAAESAHSASHAIDLAAYDGVFSVKVKVRTGGASAGREANNFWALRAVDANGNQFGYWQGTPTTVRARNPLDANQASAVQTLGPAFKVMEMRIHTATKTAEYYFDGALVISYPFNTTGGLAGIRFERINGAETSATEYVYLDDAEVTASELYHLRRFDVNVVGCSYAVDPGSAFTVSGGCTDNTTRSFAVINTGVTTITSLMVDTVQSGTGPTWPHYTFSWLPGTETWPSTIPCNLAPGESVEVSYTIDWTQLVGGFPQSALFKFNIAGCPDALGETKIGLTADKVVVPASYQLITYPAAMMPQDPNSAGPGQQFDVFDTTASQADWTLLTALTDPNALDAEDQKALRINDLSSNKTKFYSTPAANIVQATGATVVARVKTVSFDGSARYGNLWIYGPDISTEVFWGGPTGELRESRGSRVILPGDDQYHLIRVTSRDTGSSAGIVINVYFDEDPIPKISVTNASPYNSDIPGGVSGFGFGVLATADAQDLHVDCFNGTDAGAFAPGEEVGCIGRSLTVCNPCHSPFADVDDDGDVDHADFAVLQLCYTGPDATSVPTDPEYCACLDHADDDNNPATPPGADGNIDSFDLTAFERCASGPGVPADPNCQ